MRILFVSHSFPRARGDVAGAFVHRLARALADGGDEVRVLAPSALGLPSAEDVDGIPTTRYRYAPRAWETLAYGGDMASQVGGSWRGKLAFAGMIARGALAVRREVRAWRPDVVHAHWWFPGGLQSAFTRGRAPLVTTLHGSDVRLALASPIAHRPLRAVVARSSRVTAVSSWLASQAATMAPGLRALVAPMPVDASLFVPGAGRHATRLLFVGRLNAQKGIAQLLEALAASTAGASLDVVGDGEDRASLAARAEQLGIAHRVTWQGALPQERLVPFYQGAAALVIPSEGEGLGLVAVEAQLCETPVIAFRSGGLTDVVTDGETGLLVPPRDRAALAAAIDALVSSPDRGAALGRAGRQLALARFTPAAAAATYRAVYDEAIADGR
ncbi:MAG: glycosyltransferase [Gemmatimonadetes bacterium]|nr:glycosyltransferase [Gemmatimonadota bacterium]